MNPAHDPILLSRIEDAGINASAPRQQRWLDGWLVRFSPGKAKRARCINAVAMGRMAIAEKLALCGGIYEAAGLPLHVRVTPFSQPPDLDRQLDEIGLARQDDTRVMVAADFGRRLVAVQLHRGRIERLDPRAFAELVGGFRGSTSTERHAHAERLSQSPVPFQAFALTDSDGMPLACGQFAMEAELVGLYDVYTAEPYRGHGHARALCLEMLQVAAGRGATVVYLQVEADNAPARRVYRALGFEDAYDYHYRTAERPAAEILPRT